MALACRPVCTNSRALANICSQTMLELPADHVLSPRTDAVFASIFAGPRVWRRVAE